LPLRKGEGGIEESEGKMSDCRDHDETEKPWMCDCTARKMEKMASELRAAQDQIRRMRRCVNCAYQHRFEPINPCDICISYGHWKWEGEK
jgi:hypothetical protein